MSHFSPMMQRVRREGILGGPKIPRKGRIRFFLILLILGLIIWVKFSGTTTITDSNVSEKKVQEIKVKKIEPKKTQKAKNTKKENSPKPAAVIIEKKPQAEFTVNTIRQMLESKNHSFDTPCDTLTIAKRTLTFHYSIDTTLQKTGNTLMRRYKPRYGAIVAIEPVSGRILSLVSWKHDSVPSLGAALYCRSLFPAASVYKTITAAAAVEMAGFTSESTVKHTGKNHTLYKYQLEPELKIYKDVSLEQAYVNSINPVFARIGMYALRKGTLEEFGKRFGFDSDVPFELQVERSQVQPPDSNLTIGELASGFNQKTTLSPLLGALIASAISEQGRMPQPHIVDSITDNDSTLYRVESKLWKTAVNSNTAEVMKGMMMGVSRYGTARKSFSTIKKSARFDEIDYGGKTGSVDKDSTGRVDWFIGFARHPQDKRQRIAVGIVTVHGAYWTVHSSYIAAELFRVYLRQIQVEEKKKAEAGEEDKSG